MKTGEKNAVNLVVVIVLSASGALLALLATWQTMQIMGGAVIPLCRVNRWLNCAVAHGSGFAWLLGVPVSWWGFLYYFWLVLFASRRPAPEQCPGAWHSALLLSAVSLLFTLIATAYSFIQLQSFCPICILMYIINILLFIQFYPFRPGLLQEVRNLVDDLRLKDEIRIKKHSSPVVMLSFFLFFILGAGGFRLIMPTSQQRIDINKELSRFYEQPSHSCPHTDRPMLGDSSAAIKIWLISDFECPYCAMAGRHLRRLISRHPGQTSVTFVHYPLDKEINPYIPESVHKSAGMLARAAVCAHQFGKFWSFHDSLFANLGGMNENIIHALATSQQISIPEFIGCLASARTVNTIAQDIEFAHSLDISGTPAVFLNGRPLEMWFYAPLLEEIVLQELSLVNKK